MGQVFKKYWTTICKKPKGFKSLGSNIYEYQVHFAVPILIGVKTEYYQEMIPTHYEYVGNHGERKILADKFMESVKKITGVQLTEIATEVFRRDGILVPFVEVVPVPTDQVEKYLQFRDMRERVKKINQITGKIK